MDNILTDIDGNNYATIQIGNQIWMAENLRVTHFNNGDPIPFVEEDKLWEKAGKDNLPAYCYFQNKSIYEKTYGKLYNWPAVIDSRGLAPQGWHIPTELEWNELEAFIGKRTAGDKLKSSDGWYRKKNGTNESGFNGLPGGDRSWNGFCDGDELKKFGTWHSSDKDKFAGVTLNYDERWLIYSLMNTSGMGHYVRCIKNI